MYNKYIYKYSYSKQWIQFWSHWLQKCHTTKWSQVFMIRFLKTTNNIAKHLWPNCGKRIQITHSYLIIFHMKSIKLSKIFLKFMKASKLILYESSKKYSGNTTALYKILLNTLRNAPNYMCGLDPLSKIGSHLVYCRWHYIYHFPEKMADHNHAELLLVNDYNY